MDFLFNPNPLPIGPVRKSNEFQYYVWQYKQKLVQEKKEERILAQMLENIEKEQQLKDSKKYEKKKKPHFMGSFYEYNMNWKNKVEEKVKIEQMIQEEEEERRDEEGMIPLRMPEKKQMSIYYQGPVSGWEDHFKEYLRKKTDKGNLEEEGVTFHPQINERSKKIAEKITGRVEDRLIMFGEMQKLRQKQEQFINRQNFTQSNNNNNNYSFTLSLQDRNSSTYSYSDPFIRLYKEGEQLSKRKKVEELKDQHSFHPKINKLPQQIEDKIMKKRKPLYYIKNSLSQNNSLGDESNPKQLPNRIGNFKQFMERNQILLNNRNKMCSMKNDLIQQKQNKERSHCTFSPNLNKNSMRISNFVKKTNKTFEQKILSNISSEFLVEQKQFMKEPINISKVTLSENKFDTSYEDSDSLSRFVGDSSVKQTKRKYLFHEEIIKNQKGIVHQEQQEPQEEEGQMVCSQLKTQQLRTELSSKDMTHSGRRTGTTGTRDLTGQLQDSIEKMKDQQWEAQLSQIQNHLESMMARVVRFD